VIETPSIALQRCTTDSAFSFRIVLTAVELSVPLPLAPLCGLSLFRNV
jgi:hypothetical protein